MSLPLVIVLLPVIAYGVIVAAMVLFQRRFIFLPTAEGLATPADFGVSFERVKLPSTSGLELCGWFVNNPSRVENESRPVIVYLQGNAGSLSDRAKVAALFDSIGVDTVMISYRGYGDSGFGVVTPAEQQLYEDAAAAYRFALTKTSAERIIVWGHSLGAAVASNLAAHQKVAGLILESPFTRVTEMVRVRHPWLFVPSSLVFHKFPTIEHVRACQCPLLVLVAQDDEVVPPRFGAEVFASAREPKTFIPLDGVQHSGLPEAFERFREPISNFIHQAV